MDLPVSNQEVLDELYLRRRDYADRMRTAESRGDTKARHTLHLRLREVRSLILESGGNPDA